MNIDFLTVVILVGLGAIHWFCDFVLQTREQAINKSSSNYYLTTHVLTYTTGFWVLLLILGTVFYLCTGKFSYNLFMDYKSKVFVFSLITFIMHWITDYFTSRLNAKFWKNGGASNPHFWESLGADQWVYHFPQLALTWYFVF